MRQSIAMSNDSYWSRLWIVQEVYLVKDILVLDRYRSCSWEDIMQWFYSLGHLGLTNEIKRFRNLHWIHYLSAQLVR